MIYCATDLRPCKAEDVLLQPRGAEAVGDGAEGGRGRQGERDKLIIKSIKIIFNYSLIKGERLQRRVRLEAPRAARHAGQRRAGEARHLHGGRTTFNTQFDLYGTCNNCRT